MWLENLKELKKAKGMSSKQIAEAANLPERTVVRLFSGDTPNPYVDTIYRVVVVLDGSLDDVLADSKSVVGSKSLVTLQCEIDQLRAENRLITADNAVLKDKVGALSAEVDLLKVKLAHKEEIIAIHNYYNTLIDGMAKI